MAVSDRRRQFDGWNVGFINHNGPFDLGFHSRCNNNYHNMNGSPNLNQYNSPGLYHHTNQNWNYWLHACPGGSTPDFKWQEWSNGGHNQNPKKPLGLQTKPPKNPWTKIQPPKPFYLSHIVTATQKYICLVTQENPEIENFTPKILLWSSLSLEICSPPPMHGNNSSHTQGPTPSHTWQVRGPFSKSQVSVRLASWKLITANSLSTDTSIKGTPH